MMDLIYRRRMKFKCCSHLSVATGIFWRGFSHHCKRLIESIMRCLWTFSCHFSFIHNGNSQSAGKSLKRWAATAWKMCFSPLVEMRHSLRPLYFRKQDTFRAASCVSAWMFKDTEEEECLWQKSLSSGTNCIATRLRWYRFWVCCSHVCTWIEARHKTLLILRATTRKECSDRGQGMLKKGYAAGSGSLMRVNEKQVAENTEMKSKWRATRRGERRERLSGDSIK